MQEKVIEIAFNYDRFIESQKLIWTESFRKNVKILTWHTAVSAAVVIISLSVKLNDFSPVIFLVSGGFFIYTLFKWWKVYKAKMAYFKQTKQYAIVICKK